MTFLITAGPTREAIDPVRYLSNHSSGKMGYAIAEAAATAGHRVILISGPTNEPVPDRVDFIPAESAADMYQAVSQWIGIADIAIFSAAVADYTPAKVALQKMKKKGGDLTLQLTPTKDILAAARTEFGYTKKLVGFAAETENLVENARGKLRRKGCDLVVANDVSRTDIGFNSTQNEVTLVTIDSEEQLAKMSKVELGEYLVQLLT